MDINQIKIIAILTVLIMICRTLKLSIDGFNHLKIINFKQYKKECVDLKKNASFRDYINKDSKNVLTWFLNVFIMLISVDFMIYFLG